MNRTRRRILAATASAGVGSLIVPTVTAKENGQHETESKDLPRWISENPENEVEIVEVDRRFPSSSDGPSTQSHGGVPDMVIGKTIEVQKRTIGLEITVNDLDNALCNWGFEVGVGVFSASGDRTHCEGDNSISVSPGPLTFTLAAEPLDGTIADDGMKLTGEACIGAFIFEHCESLSYDIEFP